MSGRSDRIMADHKLGRPRKILDANKIAELVGKGFTVEWVADFMDVHVDTLYANYSDALRKGKCFRNGCLQAKQYKAAMTGNTTLLIWLGKQWLGQSDKVENTEKRVVLPLGWDELTSENPTRVC